MGTLTPRANSGKWKIDHHQCGCYLCFSPPNGTIAEERVQRRLAAILYADVVGYSRLMGADEEKDPRRSRGRQGRIDRSDDAVHYAVVVQQGMEDHNTNLPESERIHFRIGINIDDIIIEADDIYGDDVSENTLETIE
jgi:adenylate cyclase